MTESLDTAVIDNVSQPLGDLLLEEMSGADEFRAVSAFLSSGGLTVVEGEMRRILENEGRVSVVHGADFRITDPDAISALTDMKTRFSATMTYLVHFDWNLLRRQRFHPKMYLSTADYQRYCAVVGSSNLTLGGLRDNAEVNVVMRGGRSAAPILQCLGAFDRIISETALLEPTPQFVEKYTELYSQAALLPLQDAPPSGLDDLYRELEVLRLVPAPEVVVPLTQLDYVVLAIANLTERDAPVRGRISDAGGGRRYVHLSAIYAETERLARNAGKQYVWSAIQTSVRGRINDNVGGKGRGFFERSPQAPGEYRLTDAGRAYGERLG